MIQIGFGLPFASLIQSRQRLVRYPGAVAAIEPCATAPYRPLGGQTLSILGEGHSHTPHAINPAIANAAISSVAMSSSRCIMVRPSGNSW